MSRFARGLNISEWSVFDCVLRARRPGREYTVYYSFSTQMLAPFTLLKCCFTECIQTSGLSYLWSQHGHSSLIHKRVVARSQLCKADNELFKLRWLCGQKTSVFIKITILKATYTLCKLKTPPVLTIDGTKSPFNISEKGLCYFYFRIFI